MAIGYTRTFEIGGSRVRDIDLAEPSMQPDTIDTAVSLKRDIDCDMYNPSRQLFACPILLELDQSLDTSTVSMHSQSTGDTGPGWNPMAMTEDWQGEV